MPGDLDIGCCDGRELILAEFEIGMDSESLVVDIDPDGVDLGVPTNIESISTLPPITRIIRQLIDYRYIPLDRDGDW